MPRNWVECVIYYVAPIVFLAVLATAFLLIYYVAEVLHR